jgi:hypothetical protein
MTSLKKEELTKVWLSVAGFCPSCQMLMLAGLPEAAKLLFVIKNIIFVFC